MGTVGVRIQCFESLRYLRRLVVDRNTIKFGQCERSQERSNPTGDHFTPSSFVMTPFSRRSLGLATEQLIDLVPFTI